MAYRQKRFISRLSRGWEVQDQGAAWWGRTLFWFPTAVVSLGPHAVLGVGALQPSSLEGRISPCGFWWGHRLCSHFRSSWLSLCRSCAVCLACEPFLYHSLQTLPCHSRRLDLHQRLAWTSLNCSSHVGFDLFPVVCVINNTWMNIFW